MSECFMPGEPFFTYIMARTSYIMIVQLSAVDMPLHSLTQTHCPDSEPTSLLLLLNAVCLVEK
jgi:hypothetical protein